MALMNFSMGDIGDLLRAGREMVTGKAVIDPTKMAEFELKSREIEQALLQGQIEINKEEAKHPSVFVAGWRPAIGWIGATAIGIQFIVRPIADWIAAFIGNPVVLPAMDPTQLFNLILALLGIGAYRSYDKQKGTDTKQISK